MGKIDDIVNNWKWSLLWTMIWSWVIGILAHEFIMNIGHIDTDRFWVLIVTLILSEFLLGMNVSKLKGHIVGVQSVEGQSPESKGF